MFKPGDSKNVPFETKGTQREFWLGHGSWKRFQGRARRAAGAVRGAAGGAGVPVREACVSVRTAVSVSQGTALCRRVLRAVMC